MNQLSWLLYFANVAGTAHVVLLFIIFVTLVASAVFGIIYASNREEAYTQFITGKGYSSEKVVERKAEDIISAKKFLKFVLSFARRCFVTFCVTLLAFVFIPRAETVYAIAASEMGEQILKTPTAGKAVKALESWLDKQIRENQK